MICGASRVRGVCIRHTLSSIIELLELIIGLLLLDFYTIVNVRCEKSILLHYLLITPRVPSQPFCPVSIKLQTVQEAPRALQKEQLQS